MELTATENQDFTFQKIFYMCGVKIVGITPRGLCENIKRHLEFDGQPYPVRFVNAYSLSRADKVPNYRMILNGVGANISDSATIVKLLRFTFPKFRKHVIQIRGSDFLRFMLANNDRNIGHVFIGTNPSTLLALKTNLVINYPNARFGAFIPLSYSEDVEFLIESILNLYQPQNGDVIWLSLGTPKQDFVSNRLSKALNRPVIGIGAAFDFISGSTPEAPHFIIALNLEWLFRLVSEPKRLWKRYLLSNFIFLAKWIRFLVTDVPLTWKINQRG